MGETESIYQSQGPAKKATLLKRLTLSRVKEGDDIRQHLDQFFDAVDKLREMKLEVNDDPFGNYVAIQFTTKFRKLSMCY